ncbi:MAG: peptidase [Polymorphobacter sp.]
MTYCVGMLVGEGLVMMADTRTNAGVDNISTYRKLRVMDTAPDRVMMIASAGSLSVTQAAINRVSEGRLIAPDDSEGARETLDTVPSLFRAAQLIGEALREAKQAIDAGMTAKDVKTDVSLLFGGSIGGRKPRLFLIYGEGNFIECQPDTPYLQIGERKYGKPILDRMIRFDTPLAEAVKVALISFSSTMRSNLAVGLPIDLVTVRSGVSVVELQHRITAEDPYYRELNERWSTALRLAAAAIPLPPYGSAAMQGELV